MTRKSLILLVILALTLIAAVPASSQEVVTEPLTVPITEEGIVYDPLAQASGVEGWIWAMRYTSPPAEPRDLAGGRVQAILGAGKWGFAFRGDFSGLPGEFDQVDIATFRTLEGHIGVHRNVGAAEGVQVGVALGTGLAVSLEVGEDGLPPITANKFSYGADLRVAGKGWWSYLLFGQYQALPGFSLIGTYQVKMTERTAAVGTFAYGGQQLYVAQLGVAVRWW